eukprot:GHVU01217042.1.p2 GENE.GHVU01217042.1~~GHVU01217042.1.p2  ORF type:complete len:104 (-),score=0.37 GHVU01217042.1:355-666(-)
MGAVERPIGRRSCMHACMHAWAVLSPLCRVSPHPYALCNGLRSAMGFKSGVLRYRQLLADGWIYMYRERGIHVDKQTYIYICMSVGGCLESESGDAHHAVDSL